MEIENEQKNKNVENEEASMEGNLLEGEENYSMENSQMIVLDEVGETFTHSDGQIIEDPSGIMEQQSAGEEVGDCMGESEEGGFGALVHHSTFKEHQDTTEGQDSDIGKQSGVESEQNPDLNKDTETTPRVATQIVDEEQNLVAEDNLENKNQAQQESSKESTKESNQNADELTESPVVHKETSKCIEIIEIKDNDSVTGTQNSGTDKDAQITGGDTANKTTEESSNEKNVKSREKSPIGSPTTTTTTTTAVKKTSQSSAKKKTPNNRAQKFKKNRLSAAQRRRIRMLEARKEQRMRMKNNKKKKQWRENVWDDDDDDATRSEQIVAPIWSGSWLSGETIVVQRHLESDTISYPLHYYQNLPKPPRSPNPPRLRETYIPSNQTENSMISLFPGNTSRDRTNQNRSQNREVERLRRPGDSNSSDSRYPNKRPRRDSQSDQKTSPPQKKRRPDLRSRVSSRPDERYRNNSQNAPKGSGTRGGRGSNSNQTSKCPPNNRERDRSNSNNRGQKPVEPSKVSAAVVQGSVSQTALTDSHLSLLKSSIIEAIMTLPRGTFIPRFLNSYLKLGAIIIVCAEKESREWLKSIITKIQPWSEGPPLRIVDPGTLGKVYKMELRIPGDPMEPHEVLRLIACQNQGLRSELWTVCGRSRKNSKGFTLVVEVDHNSYSALKALDWQPYVGLSRASMGLLR